MLLPLLAANENDPRMWIAMGFGSLVLCYLLMRNSKRKKDPLDRPANFSSLSQTREVERQMQTLLVDLNEMARQMSAQLDTRSAKLEQLIADADERIALLQSMQSAQPPAPMERVPRFNPTPSEPPAEIDPRHAEVYRLSDTGLSPGEVAQQLNRPRGEIELILALRAK